MSKFKVGDRVREISSRITGEIVVLRSAIIYPYGIKTDKVANDINNEDWVIKFNCRSNNLIGNDSTLELVSNKVEKEPKFKVGDRVRIIYPNKSGTAWADSNRGQLVNIESLGKIEQNGTWYNVSNSGCVWDYEIELVEEKCEPCSSNIFVGIDMGIEETINNNDTCCVSEKKSAGIMSKISSFVRNSLLSADDKLLRKYCLQDACGDYTDEAVDLVKAKLVADNRAYLVEQAKALEAEEKASK